MGLHLHLLLLLAAPSATALRFRLDEAQDEAVEVTAPKAMPAAEKGFAAAFPGALLQLQSDVVFASPWYQPSPLLALAVLAAVVLLGATIYAVFTKDSKEHQDDAVTPLSARIMSPVGFFMCAVGLCIIVALFVCYMPQHDVEPKIPRQWTPSEIDTWADPREDFYQYAVGNWMKQNPIPEGYPQWSAFSELSELNKDRIKKIVEGLTLKPESELSADEVKIARYYTSAMDEEAIEKNGLKSLELILNLITPERVSTDLTGLMAELVSKYGVSIPIGVGVGPDDKNSAFTIMGLGQSGLGLPDRGYYFDEDKADKRDKYVQHIGNMLFLVSGDRARADRHSKAIFQLEKSFAEVHMKREDMRDPEAMYHVMSVPEFQKKCEGGAIKWAEFFEQIGVHMTKKDYINVGSLEPVIAQSRILKETAVDTLSAYLHWQAIGDFARFDLPKAFVDEHFDFYSRTMMGVDKQQPRWKRALGKTEGSMGEAIGKIYVDNFFAGDTKDKALDYVQRVRAQLKKRIKENTWMKSEKTRQHAIEKVDSFAVKIGYPDKWQDYSSLKIEPSDHFNNVLRVRAFDWKYSMGFANKPTDKTEWGMTPQTINAYYNPTQNEICFPAAILQPPFFDPEAEDALNFGGMGAIIGHEMTHGFDDSGRKFDAEGNMKDWWTDDDAAEYTRRADVMIHQTEQFSIFGKSPNGVLTNGENLADVGGIKLAYGALMTKLEEKGESFSAKGKDGFTPQQRFFLAFARNWASNSNKDFVLQQIETDPHPPAPWRANGPPSNMQEFHDAFKTVKGESKMYRAKEDRIDIW